MKILSRLLFLTIILISNEVIGQEFFDIKLPGKNTRKKCQDCLDLINNKPKEVQFGIQRDEFDNLYFVVTRKDWFDELMRKRTDGIAIDIVSKDRYDCSKDEPDSKPYFIGELQRPRYLKELKQNMLPSEYGEVVIKVGEVPESLKNKDIEFNIVILKKKNLCYYNRFYDIKTYRWDLLDMGFYFDSLTYKTNFDSTLSDQESYILQHKKLRFEIPFEKNKSDYSRADIKPLYDSLKLTDYNIKKITIRAYSSIEGNEERNKELQKERAQSIVDALQSYQKPSIETEILVSENWVDFLDDISLTSYSYLSELSKTELKEKLNDKKLEKELEPYLRKHRKAIVILELQRKDRYNSFQVPKLISLFSKSISDQNLEQAIEIQNSIFEKVRNHESPIQFIDKLEIPEQSEYSILFNKNAIFKFLMNETDVYEAYDELNSLKDLLPNDGHINYNICALKFKIWLLGSSTVNPTDFKREINGLKKMGIPYKLVKRMLVNYEIIMSEYYMRQGDFKNKDKSLRFINSNYKSLPLTDSDYLSLAQYFSSYAKYDWATKMLSKKVKGIDVDEDLLFYYLNLTIINDRMTKRSSYRTILLNAYNINPHRFCDIFKPFGEGGITFQLLENEFLRETYCENCN